MDKDVMNPAMTSEAVIGDCGDVLIIGAGPAGLSSAYTLLDNKDLRVRILEVNPSYVGGISRTETYKGYAFDIGGHRFFSKSERVISFWHSILKDDFLRRPRLSRIFYGGKFYSYPLKAFEALRNLGMWESGLCVLSYVRSRLFPEKPEVSFRDWVSNRFGYRLFLIFFKSYTEKVWGMDCGVISADWASQRIRSLNLMTAIISGLRRSFGFKGKALAKTLIEEFDYPRRGPGMMWERVAHTFQGKGGIIDMGVTATHFQWDASQGFWTVTGQKSSGEKCFYKARHVISSAPLAETIPAIYPRPASADRAEGLAYRDFLTVALIVSPVPEFQDNWIYIHDPDVKVGRIQNFGAWSSEMIPVAGTGCLGLEYFCFEKDDLWSMSDDNLISLATQEVLKLGLVKHRHHITDGCVVRQAKAYPVYDEGYKDIIEAVCEDIKKNYPGFHMVGRNGMHKYNNQDHSMLTGFLVAENILADKEIHDVWQVNEDAEYHEEIKQDESSVSGMRFMPSRLSTKNGG